MFRRTIAITACAPHADSETAGSAGLTEKTLEDYQLAADLVVDHIEENRSEVPGADGDDGVININVPDCTAGTARELTRVPLATEIPKGVSSFATDCSASPAAQPTDDVLALVAGSRP